MDASKAQLIAEIARFPELRIGLAGKTCNNVCSYSHAGYPFTDETDNAACRAFLATPRALLKPLQAAVV